MVRGLKYGTLGFVLVALSAFAAEPVVELEDMVVVATGHETERLGTPYSVSSLGEDEIRLRLQAPTLVEALDAVPGVMLQKTGHGMTSPYLRGFTSQRAVLVTDGLRLNNSFLREGPNQYWSQVDPFFFRDVEAMMGPASVLYGSDAVGGVIYARSTPLTRGAADQGVQWHGGDAYFRYSSAEHSYSEHVEGELALGDRWSMRLGLTRQDFGTLRTGDTVDNPYTGYEQWGGNLRLRYWVDDDRAVVFGYDHFDQDNVDRVHRTLAHQDFHGTLSKGGVADLRRIFDHDRRNVFARYELRNGEGFVEEADLLLSYSYFKEYYERHRVAAGGRVQYWPTSMDTAGLRLRLQTDSDWGVWNYGVEVYHDWTDSDGWQMGNGVLTQYWQGLVADDADYLLTGLFVQNEKALSERWLLTAGARYDCARLDAARVGHDPDGDGDFDGIRSMRGNWDAVTGSLRLLYRALPDNRLNLFGGVSQGFRAPNLSDATRSDEFGGGNESPTTDLDAERFTTLEAGAKYRGQRTRLEVTVYHTFMEDRIGRLNAPVTKRNLDNGFIHGVECSAAYQPAESLSLFGMVAWQEGREDMYVDRSLALGTADYPMSRVHPLTAQVGVRWQPPEAKYWVECSVDMADDQGKYAQNEEADNRFPPDGTPGYGVVHLRTGAALTETTDLAVALENVGDKEHRVHGSGVNEPGRNLIVTLRHRF